MDGMGQFLSAHTVAMINLRTLSSDKTTHFGLNSCAQIYLAHTKNEHHSSVLPPRQPKPMSINNTSYK